MKSRILLVPVMLLVVALNGCGSDHAAMSHESSAIASPAASAAPGGAAKFNDADLAFAEGMIPHHEQAIEMADIALDSKAGASDAIKALATQIKGAQDPEVVLMKGWLTAWGQPMTMDTSDGHDVSSMDGMMSAEDMDALGKMKGPEFDRAWASMMIEHHNGAIKMAQDVKAAGSNPDAAVLADAIISAQQAEIATLTPLAAG
jgi:uncharacterized protein (DUF305 family)